MDHILPSIYPRDIQIEITVNTPPDSKLNFPSYQVAISLESDSQGMKSTSSTYVSIGNRKAPEGIISIEFDTGRVAIDYCRKLGDPIGIEFHSDAKYIPETMEFLDNHDDLILVEAFNIGIIAWNMMVLSTELYNSVHGENNESGEGDDYHEK